MVDSARLLFVLGCFVTASYSAEKPVSVTVESTLATGGGNIRQFAFDGTPDTAFQSEKNATAKDHLTLTFDAPIAITCLQVTTGPLKGDKEELTGDFLEVSADGKTFEKAATLDGHPGTAKFDGKKITAVRVRPAEDLKHPLIVREIVMESEPAVRPFKFPIEIAVNVDDAPEMKAWAEKVARVCEQQYPMLCEELWSDGFKPRTQISLRMDKDYRGVAEAGGGRIRGSVTYFKAKPDDIGAFVHETAHCVQNYPRGRHPGWLVEGVADYVRYFKYEPGKLRKMKPERAKYDGSYQTSAAFLAFVTETHDKDLVKKLNAKMRAGEFSETLWKDLTGKTAAELGEDWKASLK